MRRGRREGGDREGEGREGRRREWTKKDGSEPRKMNVEGYQRVREYASTQGL